MDNEVLFKLLEETRQQCRFAQFAFQNLRTSLNALDSEKVFFYVHAFLAHASAVSGVLWPGRAESQARGERLRTELKVSDQSPLMMRQLKPVLEAADASLEDWISRSGNRNYVEMNIMPVGTLADFKPDNFHRSLDPDTLEFHFRGVPCDLRPLADELRKIESASQSWMRSHNPW